MAGSPRGVVASVALVAATSVLLGGCAAASGEEVTQVAATLEVGPDALQEGEWFATWEQAAIAEAKRLHPELTGITAERLDLASVGERVVVRADGGYCALYGGLMVQQQWQANESMVLEECGGG